MHKQWKLMLAGLFLICSADTQAGPIKFEFTIDGFEGTGQGEAGTITGTFEGYDANGDGYISAFPFSDDQRIIDEGYGHVVDSNGNESFINEITSASFTYNGLFATGNPDPNQASVVSEFTSEHDLTDVSDEAFFPGSGFFNDVYFALNYNLSDGSGILGDDSTEGMIMGVFGQPFYFALGQFLPIPSFDDIGVIETGIPSGYILSTRIVAAGYDGDFSGTNCTNNYACGGVHTVYANDLGLPYVGSAQLTRQFAMITQVPAPAAMPLFSLTLFAALLLVLRRNNRAS